MGFFFFFFPGPPMYSPHLPSCAVQALLRRGQRSYGKPSQLQAKKEEEREEIPPQMKKKKIAVPACLFPSSVACRT